MAMVFDAATSTFVPSTAENTPQVTSIQSALTLVESLLTEAQAVIATGQLGSHSDQARRNYIIASVLLSILNTVAHGGGELIEHPATVA